MKIAFLAGSNIVHTVRWVNGLCRRGHEVHLISLHRGGDKLDSHVKKVMFPFSPVSGYYLNVPFFRAYLRKIKPDLIHAHYASGYGTFGRLSGFHPYVLSVLGSDVYDFPKYKSINRRLVIKNLISADKVCSTSHAMAKVTKHLCPSLNSISITPFGVDINNFTLDFYPKKTNFITIGTVKRLESKYGIDILIRSFAAMKESFKKKKPEVAERLQLLIVGGGSDKDSLTKLATELGVGRVTQLVGTIPYADVPVFLKKMDIYAAFSRLDSESFGVAILEASACGLPVVVSDVDGPKEVVINNETGIIVPREDVNASAAALEKLVKNSALRCRLGTAGRSHVVQNYDWEESIDVMERIYNNVIRPT